VDKRIVRILVVIVILVTTSCAVKGVREWASSKIIVELQNQVGESVTNALIESSEDQQIKSDKDGRATLYYQRSGLKVITISAGKYVTKQIKVNIPKDNDKVVNIVLSKKQQ